IPMEVKSSLASAALLNGIPEDSFQSGQPLTVTDHLLLRLSKSQGISCHPFLSEGQALGVVILGIDSIQGLEALQSLKIKMFGQVVSAALLRIMTNVQDRLGEGNSLLRRVSHEVNSPLTIIGNYAEVLHHLLTDKKNQDLTESIKSEVRRIDDIINYYLNQQEIPDFPEHSIHLNQLVRDTVNAINDAEFKPRQIVTKFDLQSDLDKVATNPVLVRQILVNLLKNAAEAVGEGGIIQLITRDGYAADSGRYVEIIVRDNGSGIAPQLQEKLFQPVVSTKGAGHSGVGLSIVKGMAEDLGGRISCHSSAESGTSFYLQIPRRDDHPVDSQE
ncbi:MAG: HAMP domain-containing histidine kinase, partial [Desulfuromusa sp.]|nr:HAMP domain-containing histidine kinase [Desulfuromusa sp.]